MVGLVIIIFYLLTTGFAVVPSPSPTVPLSVVTYESSHPYSNSYSSTNEIYSFAGAVRLSVNFSDSSFTESCCDKVSLCKDSRCSRTWGEYSGDTFPGKDSTPPLIINSNTFFLRFSSDRNVNGWGYEMDIVPIFYGEPSVEPTAQPTAAPTYRGIDYESPHPYANSMTYMTHVNDFGNASSLSVSFGGDSVTELCCDIVTLCKDISCTSNWGEYAGTYSFPGKYSSPPEVIPASSFYIRFTTDASKTYYGYFVTVTPTYSSPTVVPTAMPSHTATVFASTHYYDAFLDEITSVDIFPNATFLTVSFSPLSSTEACCDFVTFCKDSTCADNWGMYSGTDFPGMGGSDPLIIPTASVYIHFSTDGNISDWGYEMGITPQYYPMPTTAPTIAPTHTAVYYASPHPYANSEIYADHIEELVGAAALSISFDEDTSTEACCDFVTLCKDSTCADNWGMYSGTDFPGMRGSDPLIIPTASVYIHFSTDSRTTDWGYLVIVRPLYNVPSSVPTSFPTHTCIDGEYHDHGECVACPAGTHSNVDGSKCSACGHDEVSTAGSVSCHSCTFGFFPNEEQSDCVGCPAGMYNSAVTNASDFIGSHCSECSYNSWSLYGSTKCSLYRAGLSLYVALAIMALYVGLAAIRLFYCDSYDWVVVVFTVINKISDILYCTMVPFYSFSLWFSGVIFLLSSVVFFVRYVRQKRSKCKLSLPCLSYSVHLYFNKLNEDYAGWVLLKWNCTVCMEASSFNIPLLLLSILWPGIRVLVTTSVLCGSTVGSVLWLGLGAVFYDTKLFSVSPVYEFWWSVWTLGSEQSNAGGNVPIAQSCTDYSVIPEASVLSVEMVMIEDCEEQKWQDIVVPYSDGSMVDLSTPVTTTRSSRPAPSRSLSYTPTTTAISTGQSSRPAPSRSLSYTPTTTAISTSQSSRPAPSRSLSYTPTTTAISTGQSSRPAPSRSLSYSYNSAIIFQVLFSTIPLLAVQQINNYHTPSEFEQFGKYTITCFVAQLLLLLMMAWLYVVNTWVLKRTWKDKYFKFEVFPSVVCSEPVTWSSNVVEVNAVPASTATLERNAVML